MILIFFIVLLTNASTIPQAKCQCPQLLSQADCEQNKCLWENNVCSVNTNPPVDNVTSKVNYCKQFANTTCQKTLGCAWIENLCTHFTGCSAYNYSELSQCQDVSNRCITDGVHCVELSKCSDYKTQTSCNQNKDGKYCEWNNTQCIDITECSKLPQTLKTDDECRQQISTCTVGSTSGCMDSADTCANQKLETQCKWDKSMTQVCSWVENKCISQICSNAPITYTTNTQCSGFMKSCITQLNGGCIKNTTCDNIKMQQACEKDSNGLPCVWIDSKCLDSDCSKAPNTFTTDEQCKKIKDSCITTSNGCVEFITCQNSTIEKSCITNNKCTWNGSNCVDKICINNTTAKNESDCTSYSDTCTLNSITQTGCVDKVCDNILQVNDCVTDKFNNKCIWHNKCFLKTCYNAPKTLVTNSDCESWLQYCVLDDSGSGCSDMMLTCSGYLSSNSCSKTRKQKYCQWKDNQCYERQCNMANQSITTTSDCQQFKSDCILNNDQKGCMDLTINCSDRKLEQNCAYGNNPICVWKSSSSTCLQLSCLTANIVGSSNYLNSYTQNSCDTLKCVLNSSSDGCIDIPLQCSSLTINNCYKSQTNTCIFIGGLCKDKICSNLIGSSHTDCYNQMNSCTINSNNNGCTPLLTMCSQYTIQQQCIQTISGKACKWNGILCLDAICTDSTDTINYDSYDECNQFNSQCTVLSKVGGKGCTDLLATCEEYRYNYQCKISSQNKQCVWKNSQCQTLLNCGDIVLTTYTDTNCANIMSSCKANLTPNGCIPRNCADYSVAIANNDTNQTYCELVDGCTLNANSTVCITKQLACDSYQDLSQCKYATEGECVSNGSKCYYKYMDCARIATPTDDTSCTDYRAFCTKASGTATACSNRTCDSKHTSVSFQDCQNYDLTCITKADTTSCDTMLPVCSQYTDSNLCVYSTNEQYCVWDTNAGSCKAVGSATAKNCHLIVFPGVTETACNKTSKYCTVNRTQSACVTKLSDCTKYTTLVDCYKSSKGLCIQNQKVDSGAKCIDVVSTTLCSDIYLGETYVYTHTICSDIKSSCTNNSTTGCQNKTCDQADATYNTHEKCQSWLPDCTYNTSTTKCVTMKQTCLEQSISSCLQSYEGKCLVFGNKCLKFSCQLLPDTNTTHAQCYSQGQCTLANTGGCINKLMNCSDYKTQIQCYETSLIKGCFWNELNMTCINLSCDSITKAAPFNNHNSCYTVSASLKCALSNTGLGCQDLGTCSSYITQQNCIIDQNGKPCIWNTNNSQAQCSDKSCDVASISITNHNDCQTFDSTCTVKVTIDASSNQVIAGCTNLQVNCNDYQYEVQCYKTNTNKQCGWDGIKCIDYSCEVAPKTPNYSTHDQCQTFINTCTVSQNQLGCITIPQKCEDIGYEFQCIIDSNSNKCAWLNSKCQQRTCDNAPDTISTAQQCSSDWLIGCTAETTNKCKVLNCQDYLYTTDSECKLSMSKCTSDGTKCIQRGTCAQSLAQASCNQSVSGETCYWNGSECTLKTCENINQQTDCTEFKCIWDNNKCRNIGQCQDYKGTSFSECQKYNSSCTVSSDNQTCQKILNCSQFSNQEACIYGLDGPCLWIDTLKTCYLYFKCQSISFTTDKECKYISPLCTTNGQTCIPITTCAETNLQGCVKGVDGDCMSTVPALNSSLQPVCKLFTQCEDAYYLKHSECQKANIKCTTNGLTSCISLSNCSTYQKEESCVIDSNGPQYQNNLIISTGVCVWDSNVCRNQSCEDFSGLTHEQCIGFLSNCTFDGLKCTIQLVCNSYITKSICSVAYGIEGKCIWSSSLDKCQALTCDQIQNGNTLSQCKKNLASCITDGTNCISKDACSRYVTKTACNQGGTDGICVWNNESCSLMTQCTQADKDQDACLQASDRCAYKYATTQSSSSCYTHTCESYQKSNGLCKSFSSWNQQTKTACSIIEDKCQDLDLTTLDESQCLALSEYTYTWNSGKNKCQSCSTQSSNGNSSQTNGTNSNSSTPTKTVDDSAQVLFNIALILLMS